MTVPIRGLALAALILLLTGSPAPAVLRIVPDQFPTIQSAIDAALPLGDSILVRAGTYAEALELSGKNLTLFGESGAEATLLTGNDAWRILAIGAGVTPATVVSDLTFTRGMAEEGAAVQLHDAASPAIRRCRFTSNTALRAGGDSFGGALLARSGSRVVLEDCSFGGNVAGADPFEGFGFGGAIYAGAGAEITARRSAFEDNSAAGFEGGPGGAVYVSATTSAAISDCTFRNNFGSAGAGIYSTGSDLTVEACAFDGNSSGLGGGAVYFYGGDLVLATSVFFDNTSFSSPAITIEQGSTGEVRNNTVAFNTGFSGLAAIEVSAADVVIRNNIVAMNESTGIGCRGAPAPGAITCNDVWLNDPANYGGDCPDLTGIDGNISEDPIFCDAPARDLTIHLLSPCAPDAGPCGLIGARGIGCPIAGSAGDEAAPSPAVLLLPPRPNPAVPPATVAFELAAPAPVRIAIHDAAGRRVAVLAEGVFGPGRHALRWPARTADGRKLASGVYFIALEAGGVRRTERLILIR